MTAPQLAALSEWSNLKETVHLAQSSEHDHKILNQFAAMLFWMVDDANVGTTARMEFAFRFRLAVSGMKVWEQMEALVHSTLTKHPVSSITSEHFAHHSLTTFLQCTSKDILSPASPSLSDLTHNPTYLAACRVGGSLVNVKDIPFWDRRNESPSDEPSTVASSSDADGSLDGDESDYSSEDTM